MITNVVQARNRFYNLPGPAPRDRILKHMFTALIHEIVDAGLVDYSEHELDDPSYGPDCREMVASMCVVTDKPTRMDIENRLAEARKEGMKEALDVVRQHREIPWEYHVTPAFALRCAADKIARLML